MPYIGKSPEHGNFSELTDVSGSFNGSTTQFALTTRIGGIAITPVVESALLISLDGVIQEPTTDYTVSGTNITFTTAPASTVSFFGVVMGRQLDVGTPSDGTITQAKLASTFMTGASDIGGAIADADLFFIDDGAGGTLRKATMDRFKTYVAASASSPSSADGTALGSASLEWSDLFLADGGTIQFGNDQDVTLTHVADAGLLLNSSMYVTFRDSALKIHSSTDGQLDIDADTEVEITATTVDLNGNLDVSGTIVGASTISAGTAVVPDASDGAALGTTSLEWSDLYLADGAVINFGDDQDVTLTHVADAGLLLNTTMYLTFRDSALKIYSSADGQLDIDADTELEITATTVDLNGNLDVSGNFTVNGTTTTVSTTNMVVEDNLIELNTGAGSNSNDSGIIIERGSTGDNAIIHWDESADKFQVGTTTAVASATGNLSVTTGTLVANVEGSGAGLTAGTTPLTALDIDGGTDIGAALSTSDLIIVDDGAGGTNRKAALSRVTTLTDASATALAIALG